MADYGSEGRSSDGWSRAAVSSDVKTETDGCKPKYDERVMSIMEHDHSMNVEDNLFEMYYARFNHQLEETSKESEESDKNQLDTVEVKFVKHELHSRSSVSESEDAGRLSVVCEHYFGCGNRTQEEHKHLYDVKHQSELFQMEPMRFDDSQTATSVIDEESHVTAYMKDCVNDVNSRVEASIKLLNCMADVKLFQKSFVPLRNLERGRSVQPGANSENLNRQPAQAHGVASSNTTSHAAQHRVRSTLESAVSMNKKEAWPKCKLFGRLASLEQHREMCVSVSNDCPELVHLKNDVDAPVKNEQQQIQWMKYVRVLKQEDDVRYKCRVCDKKLASRGSVRNHVQMHLGDAKFECTECGKSFGRIDHLRRHAKSHAKVKSFKCSQCEMSYTRSDRLKLHIRNCHNLDNVLVRCTFPNCNKMFSRSDVIKIHMRVHTGERPYQCSRCGTAWAMLSNLNAHMRICGRRENPFKCRHCGAKFRSLSRVKRHEAVHTDKQTFACKDCDRTFVTSQRLTSHVATHVNPKEFTCADCNKSFRSVQSLKDHIKRYHVDSKPVIPMDCQRSNDVKQRHSSSQRPDDKSSYRECCRCGKWFKNLKKHMRTHAEKMPFKCKYCPMQFAWCHGLRTHLKRSHGNYLRRRQNASRKVPDDGKDVDALRTSHTGRYVPNDDVKDLQVRNSAGCAETFSEQNDCSSACAAHSDANSTRNGVRLDAQVEQSGSEESTCEKLPENYDVTSAKLSAAAVSLQQSDSECAKREHVVKREPSASPPSVTTTSQAVKREDENNSATSLSCGLCHKIFSSRATLRRHMVVHSENRPFECRSCGKCFRRSDTLSAHMTTHSKQRRP